MNSFVLWYWGFYLRLLAWVSWGQGHVHTVLHLAPRKHLIFDVDPHLFSDHGLDFLKELHIDSALAHAFSASLSLFIYFLSIALVANRQIFCVERCLICLNKCATDLFLLANSILLTALGISLYLGIAATLGKFGLKALGTYLVGSDLYSNSRVSGLDPIGVAPETVLSCFPPIELVKHVLCIGACSHHHFFFVGYVASASNWGLFAHFYIGLSLDACWGLSRCCLVNLGHWSLPLVLDSCRVLLDCVSYSLAEQRLVIKLVGSHVEVLQEGRPIVCLFSHCSHLVLQVL